jgi:hypothetical protein
MSSDLGEPQPWERIALELRACRESQREAWGEVDNATLGRYLAGEASSAEQAEVEQALQELPELRKLTEIVRDVLADVAPALDEEEPIPVEKAAAVVLPFAPKAGPARAGQFFAFLRRHSSMIAAACLLLTCAVAMPQPGFLSAPREGPTLTRAMASSREVPEDAIEPLASKTAAPGAKLKTAKVGREHLENVIFTEGELLALSAPATPKETAELNRQVVLWTRRGELARAVPPLRQAHLAYQQRFGANHPSTQKTGHRLANFYAAALNASDPAVTRAPAPSPAAPDATMTIADGATAEVFSVQAANMLGVQIVNRSTQEVQKAVVPVLVEALKTTPEAKERQTLVRALAALGPAASPALPVLTERLERSKDPQEVRAILTALTRMGPAARTALPTLMALSGRCQAAGNPSRTRPAPRSKGDHRPPSRARFTATEGKLVHKTMACLNGPDGRTGVEDQAGCLSVALVRRSTKVLRELALKAGIEVRIETQCCASDAKHHKRQHKVEERIAQDGRILYVLFDPQGATVQVQVSAALQREGLTPEKLRQGLQHCLRKGQADKALDESIKFVTDLAVQAK